GIQIMRESSSDLMDTVPGKKLKKMVIEELSDISEIRKIEEIRAHRFGPYFVFNITIGIDGSMSVERGDKIAEQAEKRLLKKDRLIRRVYVHYHPYQ
ncbi:MAG TPA: cation transporter dimerization domain-containing protein, partial [bacterium]|nr:cation transporter dimerization domain-containing protein [bacterium]